MRSCPCAGTRWMVIPSGSGQRTRKRERREVWREGERADLIERRRNQRNGSLVFHHNGHAIVDLRKAWRTATRIAGVSGKLLHDLRRSGVRDMIRAGVSPHVAMSISGHKTKAGTLRPSDPRKSSSITREPPFHAVSSLTFLFRASTVWNSSSG
jgi:integrase